MEGNQTHMLLAYCKNVFDLNIFLRMLPALSTRGWTVIFVTEKLSIWLSCRFRGVNCRLLRHARAIHSAAPLSAVDTEELALNSISASAAHDFQNGIWATLDLMCRRHPVRAVAVVNGLHVAGRTARSFALARRLPIVYLEMGNLERNLFIDPEGINAEASISVRPELLDALPVTDEEMRSWRKKYLEVQTSGQLPPQARMSRQVNLWFILDWFGFRVLRVPSTERISLIAKVLAKVAIWGYRRPQPVAPNKPYVFLPLQVSTDTNLVLFSNHDNLAAIDVAAERAKRQNYLLVVKPHPSERNTRLLRRIASLCVERGFLFTSCNTTMLVLAAEEVVTINSTVGLEAMLLDKPVTVLGRSLYGRFSKRQAYAFVMRYLIDFKPHGKEPASQDAVDRILGMIENEYTKLNSSPST